MTVPGTNRSSNLSPLYSAWIEDLLEGTTPEETRATCSDCAMLRPPGSVEDDRHIYFDPQTKCCTYMPVLPNFLAGMILRDLSSEMEVGRMSVERRLAAQVAVTPLGIGQPGGYQVWYDRSSAGFGRSRSLLCPHYLEHGGRCGIWRYRNAICSTFFCKHDRGAAGFRFWRQALEELLKNIERELSRWCVLELGLSGKALEHLLKAGDATTIEEGELEGKVKATQYRAQWDRWAGQECQFYVACAARVESLCWTDVERLCGPQVRLLARRTREAYAQLASTTVEPVLRCGSFKVVSMRPEVACVSTYSAFDPIEVPTRLLGVLQHFEGHQTSEAIANVAARENVTLDPALVRKLVDFRLLVPPEDEDEP